MRVQYPKKITFKLLKILYRNHLAYCFVEPLKCDHFLWFKILRNLFMEKYLFCHQYIKFSLFSYNLKPLAMSQHLFNCKSWEDLTNQQRNELVFENRNHTYGAYSLRKNYNHHVFLALLFSCGGIFLLFFIPKLFLITPNDVPLISESQVQIEIPIYLQPEIKKPIEPISKATDTTVPKTLAQSNNLPPKASDTPNNENLTPQNKLTSLGTKNEIGEISTSVPITEVKTEDNEPTSQSIPVSVEVMPIFPGGEAALFKYLQQNIRYPKEAKENGIKGTVIVGFIIDIYGKPIHVSVLRGVKGGQDLENEALRVIAAMPLWSIGLQNNRPTPVQFSIPVKFDLK